MVWKIPDIIVAAIRSIEIPQNKNVFQFEENIVTIPEQ
jgi:hypothetical protein